MGHDILKQTNAMPAPTWHFLSMNDTSIKIPKDTAVKSCITVLDPSSVQPSRGEFEDALSAAQSSWERKYPAPTPAELAQRAAFLEAEADATYGGTAQSTYQAQADALEHAHSVIRAFQSGTGEETSAYLRRNASEHLTINADANTIVNNRIAVEAERGAASIVAIDVIARRGSTVNLSVVIAPSSSGPEKPEGLVGTTLRVLTEKDAHVTIERTQACEEWLTDIDDMGILAAEGAHLAIRQTVLGAGKSYTGLTADLRGDRSRLDLKTSYLGCGAQMLDFNYIVRHHGKQSECDLQANGVLSGKSSKILRGTIDLIRGAKGAQGTEHESVLLVDEGVRNRSVPVILCNEDDVAGNHGATIGHIRDEQLFYLSSRGLSRDSMEHMLVETFLEQSAIDASDDVARAAIIQRGEMVAPGFALLFEEDE